MGVGEQVETIQMTTLLRTTKYWEESWKLQETCCHSDFSEEPSANTDVKNSIRDEIIIIIIIIMIIIIIIIIMIAVQLSPLH